MTKFAAYDNSSIYAIGDTADEAIKVARRDAREPEAEFDTAPISDELAARRDVPEMPLPFNPYPETERTKMIYDNKTCNTFVADMEAAGFEVTHYRDKWCWEGPAVSCSGSDYQGVVRATKVKLQQDHMGRGIIYYPLRSGKLIKETSTSSSEAE